jgi:fructosamine-3-kinase
MEAGPALIDPSAYYGHREVDLAMADLFGGFGKEFWTAYTQSWPLLPGYEARRRVYQLYYLLVHVNLFGGAYLSQTRETLRSVVAR